jgi:DNA-binding transcriptional MerR regulator
MINVRIAADLLSVAASTVRRWSTEFEEFLAPAANPAPGQPRFYTDDDLAILNTVLVLRGQRQPFHAIRDALARGERLEPLTDPRDDMPPIVEPPPAAPPAESQLVPYGMVEKFMNMFEQSNSARIVAESRAASEQARADMLQERLDQLMGAEADGRQPEAEQEEGQPEATPADGKPDSPGETSDGLNQVSTVPETPVEQVADEVAPPEPLRSRKSFFARAWAAWVYLIENKSID